MFSPENKGLLASLFIFGYGFGSLFWVPIQTVFVNPTNVQAEIDNNCTYINTKYEDRFDFYFVDEDLLERVPWMLFLLGCIYLVLGFLGLPLISDPAQDNINLKTRIFQKLEENKTMNNFECFENCGVLPGRVSDMHVLV